MDYTTYELNNMKIERLFIYQKKLLQNLRFLLNDVMSDKNEIFFKLQEVEMINLAITKKLKNEKR